MRGQHENDYDNANDAGTASGREVAAVIPQFFSRDCRRHRMIGRQWKASI
jgi:hypothetical protein